VQNTILKEKKLMVLQVAIIKAKIFKRKSMNASPTALVIEATLIFRLKLPSQLWLLISQQSKNKKLRYNMLTQLLSMIEMQT